MTLYCTPIYYLVVGLILNSVTEKAFSQIHDLNTIKYLISS